LKPIERQLATIFGAAQLSSFKNAMAGQFLVMAHRQGSYMKRMIVSFFIVLLFASHLAAQSSLRRRPVGLSSAIGFATYLDSRDPLSFFNTRPNRTPQPNRHLQIPFQ